MRLQYTAKPHVVLNEQAGLLSALLVFFCVEVKPNEYEILFY